MNFGKVEVTDKDIRALKEKLAKSAAELKGQMEKKRMGELEGKVARLEKMLEARVAVEEAKVEGGLAEVKV